MNNDNRNWILAIVISFSILIVYEMFFAGRQPATDPETPAQEQRAPE